MGRISVIIQEGLYTGESTLEKSPLNVVKSGSAFSSNKPSECNVWKLLHSEEKPRWDQRIHTGENPTSAMTVGKSSVTTQT